MKQTNFIWKKKNWGVVKWLRFQKSDPRLILFTKTLIRFFLSLKLPHALTFFFTFFEYHFLDPKFLELQKKILNYTPSLSPINIMQIRRVFFMPPPPDIAKVLVPCAAAALVPSNLRSVQIKCCDLCGCAATNYLCRTEWRVWVLCNWSLLQAETFADRNLCRSACALCR